MIPLTLLRPLLIYIVAPILILLFTYYKGYTAGSDAVKQSMIQAEREVSDKLRDAERKNEELRNEQEKERVNASTDSLSNIVCLFNAYFGASPKAVVPAKPTKPKIKAYLKRVLPSETLESSTSTLKPKTDTQTP